MQHNHEGPPSMPLESPVETEVAILVPVPKHCPLPVPTNPEATVGMPKLPSRVFTSNPIIEDTQTTKLVPKLQWKVAPIYWDEVQGREGRECTARSTVVGSWTGQAEKFRKTMSNSSQVKVIGS